MCCPIITFGQPHNKISFIQVQTNQQSGQVQIKNVSRSHSFSLLEEQIDRLTQAPIHQDITQPLCDIVEEVEAEKPSPNINNGIGHTKVAILVIDGSIPLGDDPVKVSVEFKRRNIVLIVVAEVDPRYDILYFYRELARSTGGEYMLLEDVSSMWSNVMDALILRIDADLHEITDDAGDLPFDHNLY
ncbi:unnamed protein product [Adineta steineri]|uniref:Uncharacterized protein n=1 Tax=Adineta steineri TaxID=433720 RepID=A0A814Y2Y3_9BILA|nr:unnamed protein product [Adineta steineri]CAF4021294.1 unnamed protein product [Adineta steineri]